MNKREIFGIVIIVIGLFIIGYNLFPYLLPENNNRINYFITNFTGENTNIGSSASNLLNNGDNTTNETQCFSDSDCVKAQTTCCPCSSGGEEKCVPKELAENYTKKLEKCPKDLICAQVYNCRAESCKCNGGKCK